ncbi:hypothetical protein ON010_g14326 [Phytophthora cinnamomi]|nr:hypothetical protein ON010_g14326 [Phytophthora cinnamomi]
MSAPTEKKDSWVVKSNLSIDQYYELQTAKFGDVVDFGDYDEDMGDENDSSSMRKDSVSSESLDPHAGNFRPYEGDESDASNSKRPRAESDTPLASAGLYFIARSTCYRNF